MINTQKTKTMRNNLEFCYITKKKFDQQQSEYYFSCVEKVTDDSIIINRYTTGHYNRLVGKYEIKKDGTIIQLPII